MIVMKFGGTSNQDATAVANVVGIIRSRLDAKPIVVISAIAQATNVLERAGSLAADGKAGEARDALLKLFNRHYAMTDELIKDRERHRALRTTFTGALGELEELVRGVSILRELTPRTLDAFYCYGELLSSRIVTAALQEQGVDAVWVDTKNFMITDDRHTTAMPVMEKVAGRLAAVVHPLLEAGKVPVTQGFIGVTEAGVRTTMGRESSDYSAAIIGAAMDATDVQIWTDVDGILTADPTIVASPRKVRVLSFDEAFELSFFGAKVLHPNTMLPALEKNIPIHIFNSRRPQLSGSRVMAGNDGTRPAVKSIAYRKDVTIITVRPRRRFNQHIFWEHIHGVLTRYDALTLCMTTSEFNAAIALSSREQVGAIAQELGEIGPVDVRSGKGILAVIGQGLRDTPRLLEKVFHSTASFDISMICYGSTPSALCLILDSSVIAAAVRSVHGEFFDTEVDEDTFETLGHLSDTRAE